MDNAVDHFMAFTNASAEVARRYLGLTENNSEQAIQLFFDSPELASGLEQASPQSAPPPIPTSSRPRVPPARTNTENARAAVIVDSDDDENMDLDEDNDEDNDAARAAALGRAADYEDDEAIARRMQEELYAGGDASGGFGADGVRAPIGRVTETLVGGADGDWSPDDMNAAVMQQMGARRAGRSGTY